MRAFEPQRFKLFVFNGQALVAADLVAAALLPGLDDIARHRVDELLLEPIAGGLVDLPERHPLARRRRGEHRDWAGDERELEVALPERPRRCHTQTPIRDDPPPHLSSWSDSVFGVGRTARFRHSFAIRSRGRYDGRALVRSNTVFYFPSGTAQARRPLRLREAWGSCAKVELPHGHGGGISAHCLGLPEISRSHLEPSNKRLHAEFGPGLGQASGTGRAE